MSFLALMGLVVVVVMMVNHSSASLRLSGPYTVEVQSIEHCEDKGKDLLIYATEVHKVSATQAVYSGPWRWPFVFEDSTWRVDVRADRWGSGGWGRNAVVLQTKKPCSDAQRYLKRLFESLEAAAAMRPGCPIPAGDYEVKEWTVNLTLPFPEMFYGQYRIDSQFFYRGDLVGCMRFRCDIKEKV